MKRLFLFAVRVFFRRITVLGRERIPAEGPALLVANHVNSLLDPLLLYVAAPRPVRFLAKAPLFKHPLLGPVLRFLKALPVQRRQDAGSDMSQNTVTFEACEKALLEGEMIALFPEGLSHDEPHLQPLKTGAARITGRAMRDGAKVQLIPVGLTYAEKTVFRSDVTLIVGHAIRFDDLPWGDGEVPEAVLACTQRIEDGLKSLTANAERWEDLELVEGLRPMALELAGAVEEEIPPAEANVQLLEKYYEAREKSPEEIKALLKEAKPYLRVLKLLGILDEDVRREVTARGAFAYAWKRLLLIALLYPPALYGWLWHLIPYRLTDPIARLISPKDDVLATTKLYMGSFLFLLFYALQGALLWACFGWICAVCAVVLAVPCGLWALRYFEMRDEFFRLTTAVLMLGARKKTAARLKAMRADTLRTLRPLVEMYR